ncbi:hypothetical protein BJX99DRAFT_40909 [Aspergillus californicus]
MLVFALLVQYLVLFWTNSTEYINEEVLGCQCKLPKTHDGYLLYQTEGLGGTSLRTTQSSRRLFSVLAFHVKHCQYLFRLVSSFANTFPITQPSCLSVS